MGKVDKFAVGNAVKMKFNPKGGAPVSGFHHFPNNIWIIKEASIRDNMVTIGLYRFEDNIEFQRKISMSKLLVDEDCIKVNRKLKLEKINGKNS